MRFVDLNTGELFDGSKPYIHWIQSEASTGIIYSNRLCVIGEEKISIKLDSDVFDLMRINSESIQSYKDICVKEYESIGLECPGGYAHIIYISCHSDYPGEYHSQLYIGEEEVEIASDFYAENESLYVNLSNFGVELPDDIQKAIYGCNIYECKKDNLLLNRKLKELLSNYWDVIANKGSYKSLINSLKWFEWGDLVKIKEIWKREDFGNISYDTRSLCSVLENKYNDFYNEYSKTTYLSLYVATQELDTDSFGEVKYDTELNPIIKNLQEISNLWTKDELMLKMCLLGNFYETYFMPIHLDLFHATLENIVFTNSIKICGGSLIDREDYIYNMYEFECNVKDNSEFILSNVSTQTGPDTIFGTQWDNQINYNDVYILGVDDYATVSYASDNNLIKDNDLKTIWSQLYNGVGSVVNFECKLDLDESDWIQESILIVNKHKRTTTGKINPKFNLLFTECGKYTIYIQFRTLSGKIFAKQLNITIKDVSNMKLDVYVIKPLSKSEISLVMDKGRDALPSYKQLEPNSLFTRNSVGNKYEISIPTISSYKTNGIRVNHMLVLNGDFSKDYLINNYYWTDVRGNEVNGFKTVCISKVFDFKPNLIIQNFDYLYGKHVYKEEYTYMPKFHYLELLNGDDEKDYWLKDSVVVVSAELPCGYDVNGFDWVFTNTSTNESWNIDKLQSPMVAKETLLSKGYYDVKFRYKLGESIHEVTRNSIFRII